MVIHSLGDIENKAISRKTRRIAIAAAEDKNVLLAVKEASEKKIVEPLFVGDQKKIKSLCEKIGFNTGNFQIINQENPVESAIIAVKSIREGQASILMKGLVPTAPLLRAILDKENGIKKRNVLSHLALFELKTYHKILGITDAAMNISPDISEKQDIIRNSIDIFHGLGYQKPKIAVLGPLETVNPKIPSTSDAALLTMMGTRGQIKDCLIDGPLALDNAISVEAARHKNIISEVAGDADILLAPDLNSGNILYKSLVFLAGAVTAAIITGAKVPVVLTSRADSDKTKLMSIALAAALE